MRTIAKRTVQGFAAAALALGGIAATAGTASANTDTYCQHGTCITGTNTYNSWGQYGTVEICNHQSSANDFVIWIKDDASGNTIASATTPLLYPGDCFSHGGYTTGSGDAIQVFARSGSLWSYGTDPIYPS
ncbi:hypothetical protein ACIQWA_03865 [Kitasatospora sp. NPDC098652]|uniref:hypothetical protein n=1 Tax=Kitasatospora sp. NPDC098652 TaxID=3364095 RepID=UPI0037F2727E